jgi:hypothetical protein
LYYTDLSGKSVPINYRIYKKQEGKTKNDYLREMIAEVLDWGLKPKTVTTDAWYASKENLKFLKNKELGFLVGVAKNRSCSINGRDYTQIQNLEIHRCWFNSSSKKFRQSESISEKLLPRGDAESQSDTLRVRPLGVRLRLREQKRRKKILHHIFTR